MGLETLYHYCEIARELTMRDAWRVGRVIARPYVGKKKGEFVRTSNRRDYALKPTEPTALNALQEAGYDVLAVGKIHDIFDGYGITKKSAFDQQCPWDNQTIALTNPISAVCALPIWSILMPCGDTGEIRSDTERKSRGLTKKLGELMPLLKKRGSADDHGTMETIQRIRARITQESRCRCFCIRHPIERVAPDTGYICGDRGDHCG